MDAMLRGFWYLACTGARLKRGTTRPTTMLGDAILLGRRPDGGVFAFSNACPHRGMPMHHGRYDGQNLHCCFHGWTFDSADGRCTGIPCADPEANIDPSRFGLRPYPCREVQGNLWVYMANPGPAPDPLPEPPVMPGIGRAAPQVATTMRFPCGIDLATTGFVDPAHPAFVHTSRWWKRKTPEQFRLKQKSFQPDGAGFVMARHPVRGGGLPYKLLGGDVHAEIRVELPGTRIEHIEGRTHSAVSLTAATPVSATETEVTTCLYWSLPWLAPLKPVALMLMNNFLAQDREIAVRMAANPNPPPQLFVGDADTQIRWFMRLKKEALASAAEARPFRNPLKPQTLRWRS